MKEELLIKKIDYATSNINKDICKDILNDTLKQLNIIEQKVKVINYNCKKCVIVSNDAEAITACYKKLIKDIENVKYNNLLEKLDFLKMCKIHELNHDCEVSALNINTLHNCLHK